ncbi:MAG TPA: HD domain-containing protein [Bryobacteraceae bacterium]|nr:HD domain-containing protein [Bryobacteraceae bacterium]
MGKARLIRVHEGYNKTDPATPPVQKLPSTAAWDQLRAAFLTSPDPNPVLAGITELVEDLAANAFRQTLDPLGELAMLAVGGFGRRELFPCSDVDILILIENEAQTAVLKPVLPEFVRLLWDSGLRLSHSVHTVAECLELNEHNIELSISLLDRRLLEGSAAVSDKLDSRFPAFLDRRARTLTRHLCQMTRARHAKYQGTFYHLEPDIKETPGGLRDLHSLAWLAELNNAISAPADRLAAPAHFLQTLRCHLHYQSGRDQNVLSFEAQHDLTQQAFLGFREPAEFMREYFRNTRVIYNEVRRALDIAENSESSLFSSIRDRRSRLSNSEFTVSRDRVFLRSPAQLEIDPAIFLRLFEFVARHGIPLAADTERRLESSHEAFSRFPIAEKPLWPELRKILSLPHSTIALRALHDTGLLQVLFPEWNTITCLVIPDYYHRYTVDEHTLVTIEKLDELARTTDPSAKRLAEVLTEISDPALLRFSLLFHDSGKGDNDGDHSRRSVELARKAMARIQTSRAEQDLVEFLIEHHLDLSAVMNSRDLHDPATARMLADRIGTIERLKLLAVLTYADISAVNPAAMTPWRLEQLWQTYLVAHQELVRELETDRIDQSPVDLPDPNAFLRGLPVRYLRTHTPSEIRAHLDLYDLSRPTGVAVELQRWAGVHRATIIARDAPGLFATLAGAISSFGMDIVKAEAFANRKGHILDTFIFADPKRTLELNTSESERLQETLEQVALGRLDVGRLLNGRPAPNKARRVRPSVHFNSDACDTATLVEIVAEDRPRLLYDLAHAFSSAGCNIDVVLIDTEGHRAIDVFYVASDGAKLTPQMQSLLEQKLLTVC